MLSWKRNTLRSLSCALRNGLEKRPFAYDFAKRHATRGVYKSKISFDSLHLESRMMTYTVPVCFVVWPSLDAVKLM